MYVRRDFKFDAAHNLVNYHGKCERLHGHTYKIAVVLEGVPDGEGMVMDFAELKATVNEHVLSKLDHAYINDLIPQPSAENIALWIFRTLDAPLKRENCSLHEVSVWETEDSSAVCGRKDVESIA
jgi:6-pyruvoyltetrahydropterin/6-carboxytetrahydropterin synthase